MRYDEASAVFAEGRCVFQRRWCAGDLGRCVDRRAGTGTRLVVLLHRPRAMADNGLYIPGIRSSISSIGITFNNGFNFQITHHEQPVTGRHVRARGGIAVDGIVCPVFGRFFQREGIESM